MHEGQQTLSISIVPESGTDALIGIEGVFNIQVVEGNHNYELEYTLPK